MYFMQVVLIALLWGGLFNLNSWLFATIEINSYVTWIFLPAAIRLVSVLLLGWPAAIGLFFGSMLLIPTVVGESFTQTILLSLLNAAGPMLAVGLCMRWLRMPADLRGLKPGHLAVFCIVGALCNVVPQRLYFWTANKTASPFTDMMPMFIGDLLGTLAILYLIALLLRLLSCVGIQGRSQG
jgi:hypothetical protein